MPENRATAGLRTMCPARNFVTAARWDPRWDGLPLFFARVARRFAFSRWYLGGSAALEWKAARRLWKGFDGVVHSMWADHDLGFLDLLLSKKRHKLCGTFIIAPTTFQSYNPASSPGSAISTR